MTRDFLTVADVLGMHTVLMQRYGGALGLRDPGALESALFRPQTGYYKDTATFDIAHIESWLREFVSLQSPSKLMLRDENRPPFNAF